MCSGVLTPQATLSYSSNPVCLLTEFCYVSHKGSVDKQVTRLHNRLISLCGLNGQSIIMSNAS